MKENRSKKSPFRFLFLAAAVYAGLNLLARLALCLLAWASVMQHTVDQGGASIGIIGGADGPTAIFVTASPLLSTGVAMLLLILGLAGYILLRNRKQ